LDVTLSEIEPTKKPQTLKLQEQIEDIFIEYLDLYRDPTTAALKAGYSQTYAENIRYTKLQSPKFLSKLKSKYNGNSTWMLPLIHQIESKQINLALKQANRYESKAELSEDIEEQSELTDKALSYLAKPARTNTEIKKQTGVLATEGQTTVNLVNIESIQAVIQQKHEDMLRDTDKVR